MTEDIKTPYTMTLREFRERIVDYFKDLPPETEIYFGTGDLSFHRVKPRKSDRSTGLVQLVQIEFNQVYTVDIDPETD